MLQAAVILLFTHSKSRNDTTASIFLNLMFSSASKKSHDRMPEPQYTVFIPEGFPSSFHFLTQDRRLF